MQRWRENKLDDAPTDDDDDTERKKKIQKKISRKKTHIQDSTLEDEKKKLI